MYLVTIAKIGDLAGPFYLSNNPNYQWSTERSLFGGWTAVFSNFKEAADIAAKLGASVVEA